MAMLLLYSTRIYVSYLKPRLKEKLPFRLYEIGGRGEGHKRARGNHAIIVKASTMMGRSKSLSLAKAAVDSYTQKTERETSR